MANNKENNIVYIDPLYIKYRKMWREDRWRFSGELVKLEIKRSKIGELSAQEEKIYETINRVIDENDGNWTDGYEWQEDGLRKTNKKKR